MRYHNLYTDGANKKSGKDEGEIEDNTPEFILIESADRWSFLKLFMELWDYRELVFFLIWRDVKIRYKQTLLGIGWAILQPLVMMLIFTLFFGRMAKIPSDGIPYPIFAYSGLLPWTFFANGVTQATNSMVGNTHLLTKVYFPRMLIPIASVMAGLLDFILAFVILFIMMAYYQIYPTAKWFILPVILLLLIITTVGVSLLLSALNVLYRDTRYIVPFMIQSWLFLTPVVYPSSMLSENWRLIYSINPMAGMIEGVRWVLLGTNVSSIGIMFIFSATIGVLLIILGIFCFKTMEDTFADVI